MIHHTGALEFTEITFVPCWNMEVYKVDEKANARLQPFDHSKFTTAERELGTQRMAFNFFYNQPYVWSEFLNGEVETPKMTRKYIFRSMTDQNVMLHQYVDWTHVGSETHQISTSKTINTDQGLQASITEVNVGDKADPALNQVAYDQSLFSTVQLTKVTSTEPNTKYTTQSIAVTSTEIDAETHVSMNVHNIGFGTKRYYYKFNPSTGIKQKKGYHFEATGCVDTQIGMMYSFVNPVPDINDNAGMTDFDLKRNRAELIINEVKPVYLVVQVKGSGDPTCTSIDLYSYAIGEVLKRVHSDTIVADKVTNTETFQYEMLLEGQKYNQPQAFIKLEIPAG